MNIVANVCPLEIKMSLFCHPIILLAIVVLMTPNLTFSFPSGSTQCDAFICGCHIDISVWMPAHYLKYSRDRRERLFFRCCFCPLSIITNNSTVTPATCQQFHYNFWQPAVIHQTFANTSASHTYSTPQQPVQSLSRGLGSPPSFLSRLTPFGLGFILEA